MTTAHRLHTTDCDQTPEQIAATIAARSAEIDYPLEDWQIDALVVWIRLGYLTLRPDPQP